MYRNFMVTSLLFGALAITGCKSGKSTMDAATAKTEKLAEDKSGMKPYNKVVTSQFESDPGIFTVHQNGDKFYYEIPNQILGKDMLLVSRISQIPSNSLGFQGQDNK